MLRFIVFFYGLLIPCCLWSQLDRSALRGDNDLIFYTDDLQLEAGQQYLIDFKAIDLHQYLGYQCTFVFNKMDLQFDELVLNDYSNAVGLGEDRFNLGLLDQGAITNIWSNVGISEDQNAILFSFKITALANVTLGESLDINSSFISATSVFQDGTECGVILEFEAITSIENLRITDLRIFPNPTTDYVQIEWSDSNTLTEIQLFNNLGQVIFKQRLKEWSSNYQWHFPKDLPTGQYFIRLSFGSKEIVSKLVLL